LNRTFGNVKEEKRSLSVPLITHPSQNKAWKIVKKNNTGPCKLIKGKSLAKPAL
jgi:hypothetical protein